MPYDRSWPGVAGCKRLMSARSGRSYVSRRAGAIHLTAPVKALE